MRPTGNRVRLLMRAVREPPLPFAGGGPARLKELQGQRAGPALHLEDAPPFRAPVSKTRADAKTHIHAAPFGGKAVYGQVGGAQVQNFPEPGRGSLHDCR
jgi:hypothetical protein